jgi:medium-chain acyl-[acyl-carrier-protein] hydrolase
VESRSRTRTLVWWTGPADDLNLFCVPFAGAGAAPFRRWVASVPAGVGVAGLRFPGRESRLREPPVGEVDELVEIAARAVEPHLRAPYALFGQCSGAIVAFELVRLLRRENRPLPRRLVVAAQSAPHSKTERRDPAARKDVDELLRQLGGTDAEVLDQTGLLALVKPALEADFALIDRYRYRPEPRLEVPITAIRGRDDAHVSESRLLGWEKETAAGFELVTLDADHLFSGEAWSRLAEAVAAATTAPSATAPD